MTDAVLGIDPGAISGAYALQWDDGKIVVGDLAVVDGQLDAAHLTRLVRDQGVRLAVVERVGAMPKQGVASTFKFGVAVGIIHGVLMSRLIPTHYVTPPMWKRHHGLLQKTKEDSRALAIRLHPEVLGLHLKKHQGRAEALLMTDWYMNKEKRP